MFIRNCWYVAAWSHEVGADSLLARTIIGEPVLLMRTAAGEVVALDDRCCHRGAPLSRGRREGDCVRCGYHGLKFDAQGRCVEIPGQESIPPQARVRTYPVVEQHRWIFVWMGDPQRADPALLPDNSAGDDPGFRYQPDYMHYDVDYLLIADNLLDFSHLTYVHSGTLGGSDRIALTRPEIESIPRGLRVVRRVRDVPPAPYYRNFADFPGNVDRWFDYRFVVPGILLMHSGAKPPGRPWDDFEGALHLKSCQALTPETERTTHYFFMQAHGFALDDERITDSLRASVVTAFEEDRETIRAQRRMLDLGPMRFVPIHADAALNRFRLLVQALIDEERAPGSDPARTAPDAPGAARPAGSAHAILQPALTRR